MTIELHDLAHEFPEHKDKLHALKLENAHFVHLKSQYDDVNHQIRLFEDGARLYALLNVGLSLLAGLGAAALGYAAGAAL